DGGFQRPGVPTAAPPRRRGARRRRPRRGPPVRRRPPRDLDRRRPRRCLRQDRRVPEAVEALMSFRSPWMLALFVVIPAAVAAYVAAQRRRARRAEALAAEGLVATSVAVGVGRRRRRHIPFALFVAALTVLVVALARPSTTVRTPREEGTVVLALDISNSMRATDAKPSRIEAAKAAARSFVNRQPAAVRIGVVAFGDGAVV